MKNIIKRILVGVAVGTILMLIRSNVYAENIRVTIDRCYMYYNSGTTNRSGTPYNTIAPGNLNANYCSVSVSTNYLSTRYDFNSSNIGSGIGTINFYVADSAQLSGVTITTQSRDYSCEMNTPIMIESVDYAGVYLYSVTCPNVAFANNTAFQIKIFKRSNPLTQTGSWLARDINFTLNDSSTISQVITDQSNQQHQDAQNINNSINSSTTPSGTDTNNAYSNFEGATAQNGVITSLITLPVSLFTNILGALNSSCTRFDMGTLLGTHIYFNCINPSNYLGSQLWSVIDILMSGFFVWYISRKFIKVFENLSSLKEGDPVGD